MSILSHILSTWTQKACERATGPVTLEDENMDPNTNRSNRHMVTSLKLHSCVEVMSKGEKHRLDNV